MKWKKKFRLLVISLTAICVIVLSVGGYFKSRKIKRQVKVLRWETNTYLI